MGLRKKQKGQKVYFKLVIYNYTIVYILEIKSAMYTPTCP